MRHLLLLMPIFIINDKKMENAKNLASITWLHRFFDRASRVVERALYEDIAGNVFVDYTASNSDGDVYMDKTNAGLTLNRYT